jgi:uncharacterized repeat protein (TIGR03803 family)
MKAKSNVSTRLANGWAIALAVLACLPGRAQTFATLYRFAGSPDGANPNTGLVLSANALYGTTYVGGTAGYGTVFKVNTNGTGYKVLLSLTNSPDGANPWADLVVSNNTLYGTTSGGGMNGGTVFQVNTDATGYTVLRSFGGVPNDGLYPQAGLVLAGNTTYGTTDLGGTAGSGTVFALSTDGTQFTELRSFTNSPDGARPDAMLVLSGSRLYGTTYLGGSAGYGTVFALNTDGTGYAVLKSFAGYPSDGRYPVAGLVSSGNTLYGTTKSGGSLDAGTVFKMNTDGTGYEILRSFTGAMWAGSSDAATPSSGLVLSGNTLYGTTEYGGSSGWGAVFKMNTDGTGFALLKSFTVDSPDGMDPQGILLLSGNTLYGTAHSGGNGNAGTVFRIDLIGSSAPIPLNWQSLNHGLVLSWTNAAFALQAASAIAATFTNIPGATSPYTNPISGAQQFFRLSQ